MKIAITCVSLGADSEFKALLPQNLAKASAQLLIKSGAYPKIFVQMALKGHFNSVIGLFEALLPPMYSQIYRGIGLRKLFFEKQLKSALENEIQQIVILGGGFDTLCWRLASKFSKTQFLEIDHPATSKLKSRGLQAMGKPANLHLIKADLSQTKLIKVLSKHPNWSSSNKSS